LTVLAEAAARGKPVVSTRTPASPAGVAEGETGLLWPGDDVAAFAQALGQLIASAELRRRLGDAARLRAEAEWRWERIATRMEDEVYRPLQPQGGGSRR